MSSVGKGIAEIICFDTETTGIDTATDRVVEFGAVSTTKPAEGLPRTWHEEHHYINPEQSIPAEATNIHGITDTKVANAPTFKALADDLAAYLGQPGAQLMGYNAASYDTDILNAEFERAGHSFRIDPLRVLDPVLFVRHHCRHLRSRKLGDMCAHFGVVLDHAHTAVADSRATLGLYEKMLDAGMIPDDFEVALVEQARFKAMQETEFEKWSYWIYADRNTMGAGTGVLHIGAGKHCGTALSAVDPGSLTWLLNKNKIPDLHDGARAEFEAELRRRERRVRDFDGGALLRRLRGER